MPKLPRIKSKEAIKALERLGFNKASQKDKSEMQPHKNEKTVK